MLNRPDVHALLARQLGVATAAQLTQLGIARRTVARAEQRGVLVPLLPGVYRIGSHVAVFETRAMAVQLYCGDQSYLTGTTAGVLHGLRTMPRDVIDAASSRRCRVSLPTWVNLMCSDRGDECPWTTRADGLRVANPHLMLLVLATRFDDFRFRQAAEDAWHLKLVTPSSAAAYVEQHRGKGRPGIARFDAWLERTGDRQRPSQSGLELKIIEAIEAVGLPEPERQHPLVLRSGMTIHLDIAWPGIRLAVEPGHSWWHGGDLKMRLDAARDRACSELGWLVVRYDESALDDLRAVGRELARIHARRSLPAVGGT